MIRRCGALVVLRRSSNVTNQSSLVSNVAASKTLTTTDGNGNDAVKDNSRPINLSPQTIAYLHRVKKREKVVEKEEHMYENSKIHLREMMSRRSPNATATDNEKSRLPDDFFDDQTHIDAAVRYLFPSGVDNPLARPQIAPPDRIYRRPEPACFGADGRPFHFLFYTALPNFSNLIHDIDIWLKYLYEIEIGMISNGDSGNRDSIEGQMYEPDVNSEWVKRETLEERCFEKLKVEHYKQFLFMVKRLSVRPNSALASAFLDTLRAPTVSMAVGETIKSCGTESNQRNSDYVVSFGFRKSIECVVTIKKKGIGNFVIKEEPLQRYDDTTNRLADYEDGKVFGLDYFEQLSLREEVLWPLVVAEQLGKVDVAIEYLPNSDNRRFDGFVGLSTAPMSRAGAARLGIARGLAQFVTPLQKEQLRVAGLLARDHRYRERKRPGQYKSRKLFPFKKR